MAAPISKILWGDGYENELDFQYMFFDRLGDRAPRPGSDWQQAGDGEEIAWLEGRDFVLSGEVRHISQVHGPTGWRAFLDWAGEKHDFRLVPDRDVPDFYVPDCRLISPLRTPRFGRGTDQRRRVGLAMRNPTVDFEQAYRGIMFEYEPGGSLTDPVAATFTRASVARYTSKAGLVTSTAAGVLRDRHYDLGRRTTLLERAATNLTPWSSGLATNWTSAGSVIATDGVYTLGDLVLDRLEDDDAGVNEFKFMAITFTGDGVKSGVFCVRSPDTHTDGANNRVAINDTTAVANRLDVQYTWNADGTINLAAGAATAGTVLRVELLGQAGGKPVYAVWFQTTAVTAANSHQWRAFPAGVTVADVGKGIFGGFHVENSTVPSSLVITSGAPAAQAADLLWWQWPYPPQPMFVYVEHVERGGVLGGANAFRLLAIGLSDNRLAWNTGSSGLWRFFHDVGAIFATAGVTSPVAPGDHVELLGLIFPDGDVQQVQTKNGGAEEIGARTTQDPGIPAAFDDPRLGLNGTANGGSTGVAGIRRVKIGPLTFGGVERSTIALARSA
jgi:hypothetical protein